LGAPATLLPPAGVPVKVVSERFGHTKVSMTLDVYAHVLPEMQRDSAVLLGALLHGRSPIADTGPRQLATRAHEGCLSRNGRREAMSKRSKRIALILVGAAMALLAVAQHFGWIAGPPPLLAPGIQ
jgi:hypothetical protein